MRSTNCLLKFQLLFILASGALSSDAFWDCAETPHEASDVFKFLDFHANVRNNEKTCMWVLSALSVYKHVEVEVVNSSLARRNSSDLCSKDSITAYDGLPEKDIKILTWCGRETPDFHSTDRNLTLVFRTQSSDTNTGFRLKYKQTSGSCGGNLTAIANAKHINSPGYPNNYSNFLYCMWNINTSYKNIQLLVSDVSMEGTGTCYYDSLKIYDGVSGKLLRTLCGEHEDVFITTGFIAKILFVTDGSGQGRGFTMTYHGDNNFTAPCGSNLSAIPNPRYLTFPGYPDLYENHMNCTWIISTSHHNVELEVTDSDMESSHGCPFERVEVYEGLTGSLLGKFCGQDKPRYVTSGSVARVHFVTDSANRSKGFQIKYTGGHFSTCGTTNMNASIGVQYLTSPNYPSDYPNNLDCRWILTAGHGQNIRLIVIDSSIEGSSCLSDSVKIYDGAATDAPLLGTFCGTQQPSFVSSGRDFLVRFQTDGDTTEKGFRLSYQAGLFSACDHRNLTSSLSYAEISSPFYPFDYPNNAECTWSITTGTSKYIIYIKVLSLDIEYWSDCSADYLQVFDGRDRSVRSLGKWCGNMRPLDTHSSTAYVFIEFHSNGNTKKPGFKLQYRSTLRTYYFQESSSFNIGSITGGISTAGVFIFVIIVFIIYVARKYGRKKRRPGQTGTIRLASILESRQIIRSVSDDIPEPLDPATSCPPPSYDDVMSRNRERRAETPPPSYNSFAAKPDMFSPQLSHILAGASIDVQAGDEDVTLAGASTDVGNGSGVFVSRPTDAVTYGTNLYAAPTDAGRDFCESEGYPASFIDVDTCEARASSDVRSNGVDGRDSANGKTRRSDITSSSNEGTGGAYVSAMTFSSMDSQAGDVLTVRPASGHTYV